MIPVGVGINVCVCLCGVWVCVCVFEGGIINTFLLGNPLKGSQAKGADPDQTPHNVAPDQGLPCLLKRFSFKNRRKETKLT